MTSQYENKLNQLLGKKNLLQIQLQTLNNQFFILNNLLPNIEKSQSLIQNVAENTQNQLKFHIEDIVNTGLETVFPESYNCHIDFISKRGKTECDIYLYNSNSNRINILEDSGGGLADIVSFCLRMAVWSISNNDNVLILDEPFKFLSKDLLPLSCELLKELSNKLNLQIIMITHLEEFINISNKVFNVVKNKKISEVIL